VNRRSFIQGLLSVPAVVGIKKLPKLPKKKEELPTDEEYVGYITNHFETSSGSACVMYTAIWNNEEEPKKIYSPYVEGRSKTNAT
jgi:hypothetical protein